MSDKTSKIVLYVGLIYTLAVMCTGVVGFIWGGATKTANISNTLSNITQTQEQQQQIITTLVSKYTQMDKELSVHISNNEIVIDDLKKCSGDLKSAVDRLERILLKSPISKTEIADKNS
jgi:hypothetical protein